MTKPYFYNQISPGRGPNYILQLGRLCGIFFPVIPEMKSERVRIVAHWNYKTYV